MSKAAAIVLLLFAAYSFAQDTPPGSQGASSLVIAPRSLTSIAAEARVREMETLTRLSTEGRALYDADERKLTGYQYCGIAQGLALRGEFRRAVREASKALFLGQSERNEDLVAHAKRDLSIAYSYAGHMEHAQRYAEEALNHHVNPRNRDSVHGWAYKILGDVALRRGAPKNTISLY